MRDFVLSCCSTADLSKEHFENRDIHYVCFHFYLDGKEYSDDLGQSISFDDFYQAMIHGAETKTSQVNTEEFIEDFTPFLEAGKDSRHVSLSSGISGVYNEMCIRDRPHAGDARAHGSGELLWRIGKDDLFRQGEPALPLLLPVDQNRLAAGPLHRHLAGEQHPCGCSQPVNAEKAAKQQKDRNNPNDARDRSFHDPHFLSSHRS